jgi:hypothetical protein
MIKDYSKLKCCVVDNGLFPSLAETLGKSFGTTWYHTAWVGAFPKSNTMLPGFGIPGVTRCNDIWEIKEEVDLWIFPDVYYGSLQLELQNQGKRVWGSRLGEELELHRKESKEYLKKIGLNVGKYEVIIGLDKLRNYLKAKDNVWVKISTTRGDMETFHSPNYKNIEPRLDKLERDLGAVKKIKEFIVEDSIDDAVEIGFDGFTVDGNFPKKCLAGIETKAKGYVGVFKDYKDMPKQIIDVNNKMSPTLKKYGYKNWFCNEVRIKKDGIPWVIDPLCRFGSPPGDLIQLMYTNLADIFWFGAEGKVIEPIPLAKYGVELLIASEWADNDWQAIDFPKEIADNVKFRNLCIIDKEHYVIPSHLGLGVGAIVAVGNTIDEAIKKITEISKKIETYDMEVFPESLNEAVKKNEELKKMGINLL